MKNSYVYIGTWHSVNLRLFLFIPRHTIVAGYYGFTLDVRVFVHPCVCLCISHTSICVWFLDDNLSKQWIFTKLGLCIDIVEIWFGIANGQILSNFDGVICTIHVPYFRFWTITCVNVKTKIGICIDTCIKEIWFGIANGQI